MVQRTDNDPRRSSQNSDNTRRSSASTNPNEPRTWVVFGLAADNVSPTFVPSLPKGHKEGGANNKGSLTAVHEVQGIPGTKQALFKTDDIGKIVSEVVGSFIYELILPGQSAKCAIATSEESPGEVYVASFFDPYTIDNAHVIAGYEERPKLAGILNSLLGVIDYNLELNHRLAGHSLEAPMAAARSVEDTDTHGGNFVLTDNTDGHDTNFKGYFWKKVDHAFATYDLREKPIEVEGAAGLFARLPVRVNKNLSLSTQPTSHFFDWAFHGFYTSPYFAFELLKQGHMQSAQTFDGTPSIASKVTEALSACEAGFKFAAYQKRLVAARNNFFNALDTIDDADVKETYQRYVTLKHAYDHPESPTALAALPEELRTLTNTLSRVDLNTFLTQSLNAIYGAIELHTDLLAKANHYKYMQQIFDDFSNNRPTQTDEPEVLELSTQLRREANEAAHMMMLAYADHINLVSTSNTAYNARDQVILEAAVADAIREEENIDGNDNNIVVVVDPDADQERHIARLKEQIVADIVAKNIAKRIKMAEEAKKLLKDQHSQITEVLDAIQKVFDKAIEYEHINLTSTYDRRSHKKKALEAIRNKFNDPSNPLNALLAKLTTLRDAVDFNAEIVDPVQVEAFAKALVEFNNDIDRQQLIGLIQNIEAEHPFLFDGMQRTLRRNLRIQVSGDTEKLFYNLKRLLIPHHLRDTLTYLTPDTQFLMPLKPETIAPIIADAAVPDAAPAAIRLPTQVFATTTKKPLKRSLTKQTEEVFKSEYDKQIAQILKLNNKIVKDADGKPLPAIKDMHGKTLLAKDKKQKYNTNSAIDAYYQTLQLHGVLTTNPNAIGLDKRGVLQVKGNAVDSDKFLADESAKLGTDNWLPFALREKIQDHYETVAQEVALLEQYQSETNIFKSMSQWLTGVFYYKTFLRSSLAPAWHSKRLLLESLVKGKIPNQIDLPAFSTGAGSRSTTQQLFTAVQEVHQALKMADSLLQKYYLDSIEEIIVPLDPAEAAAPVEVVVNNEQLAAAPIEVEAAVENAQPAAPVEPTTRAKSPDLKRKFCILREHYANSETAKRLKDLEAAQRVQRNGFSLTQHRQKEIMKQINHLQIQTAFDHTHSITGFLYRISNDYRNKIDAKLQFLNIVRQAALNSELCLHPDESGIIFLSLTESFIDVKINETDAQPTRITREQFLELQSSSIFTDATSSLKSVTETIALKVITDIQTIARSSEAKRMHGAVISDETFTKLRGDRVCAAPGA